MDEKKFSTLVNELKAAREELLERFRKMGDLTAEYSEESPDPRDSLFKDLDNVWSGEGEPQEGEIVFKRDGEVVRIHKITKGDILEWRLKAVRKQLKQQEEENKILHRKVNDLGHKFSQARRECNKLRNELKVTGEEFSAYLNKNIKPAAMFKNLTKAELYDEILEDASDCLVGSVIGIKHEPNDLEPDEMFYFLRITEDEAYRIDMGGYAHLEVWED